MFRLLTTSALLVLAGSVRPDCVSTQTTVSGSFAPTGQLCSGQELFNEQFNSLNTDLWQHEIRLNGPNGEFSWYTNSTKNSYTKNGVLYLHPSLTTDEIPDLTNCQIDLVGCTDSGSGCYRTCSSSNIAPPIQSALVKTAGTFNFKYGKVVIRAKLPSGKWLWPALWFLPTDSVYGNWPASGEIDLMESRGNDNLTDANSGINTGAEQFGTTLHFGNDQYDDWWSAHVTVNSASGNGFDNGFHEYGLLWSPDSIQLSLDGTVKGTFSTGDGYYAAGGFTGDNPWANGGKNAPFDQEFYFILNNAVGGTNGYFVDGQDNKPWTNSQGNPPSDFWNGRSDWLSTWNFDPTAAKNVALQVDYVKLYAL